MQPVLLPFLKLGLISFGGPVAHLGYFHTEFVQRRRWLGESEFADLVALCQFLPGPASSQMVFALGMQRAGLTGAILATLGFMLPSAVVMILFAYGVASTEWLRDFSWIHGLKLAAVAIVGHAVWAMGRSLCPDRLRLTLAMLAAAAALLASGAAAQVTIIALGALAGCTLLRGQAPPHVEAPVDDQTPPSKGHRGAVLALALFAILLVGLPIAARWSESPQMAFVDRFYRSGALVFGGGHVVLPLLRAEVVEPGWLDDRDFLAGYGAAQAVPGPLFTFAGFLGTAIALDPHGGFHLQGDLWQRHAWFAGVWALLAIFLPGWLLIGGALPFWHRLRAQPWTQAALRGVGPAVVGLLLAALYSPLITEAVGGARDAAVVLVAFALLSAWRAPPILVVALCGVAGGK